MAYHRAHEPIVLATKMQNVADDDQKSEMEFDS